MHKLIESNPEYDEAVEKIVALALSREVGSLLTYKDIEAETGVAWKAKGWQTITNRARRILRDDHGITTRCEDGVAFLLHTASETVAVCPRQRFRKSRRQAILLFKEVSNAKQATLTEHEQLVRIFAMNAAEQQYRELGTKLKEVKKPEGIPLRMPE